MKKLLLSVAVVGLISCVSMAAHAAVVEGCNKDVLDAMQKKAQALTGYDTAVTQEIVHKPDSVLAMTCFNKAAGVSADTGGNIFSGSFMSEAPFSDIVTDSLKSTYDNFGSDTLGKDTSAVDYTKTAPENSFAAGCDEMDKLWDESDKAGVTKEAPYVSFDDLVNGASGTYPTGAGDDFKQQWDAVAAQNVFSDYKTAEAKLTKPTIPDFSSSNTSCDVLTAAGITCP